MPNINLHGGTFTTEHMPTVQQWANSLDAAAQHDPDAARIARHKGIIIALTRRYVGFGVPVEDLLQIGAMSVVRALTEYDPKRGQESTFIMPRVYDAMQRATGVRVKNKHYLLDIDAPLAEDKRFTLADVVASDADTEGDVIMRDDRDRMRAALKSMWQTLSDYDRTILQLFYLEGMDGQAIADIFGVTRETVRQHLENIRGRLNAAHQLAQALRKSDGHTGRLADPSPHTKRRVRATVRKNDEKQAA